MWQRVKRFFLNNWRLKILAVLSAGLCFEGIRSATSDRAVYELPVEAALDPGLAVHTQDPMTVKVHFQGAREDLRWLDQKALRAVVRPKAVDPDGTETIMVSPRDIQGHPATVRVVNIEPPIVHFTYDREVEKFVEVAPPQVTGTPVVGKVRVEYEPRVVKVRGPERRLEAEAFSAVSTEPIDVSGKVTSFTRRLKILYPEDWVSEVDPPEVLAKVNIVTESAVKAWTNVPVRAVVEAGTTAKALFEPPAVRVSLFGRAELVETVSQDAVKVFVDCLGLDPSAAYELPVNVYLPDPELKARVEPGTVRVTFRSS